MTGKVGENEETARQNFKFILVCLYISVINNTRASCLLSASYVVLILFCLVEF